MKVWTSFSRCRVSFRRAPCRQRSLRQVSHTRAKSFECAENYNDGVIRPFDKTIDNEGAAAVPRPRQASTLTTSPSPRTTSWCCPALAYSAAPAGCSPSILNKLIKAATSIF